MHCLFMFSQRGAGADYEELQQGNNTCKSGNFNPIETPLNRTHARAPFPSGQSSDETGVMLGVKSVLANQPNPNNNINMCDMHNKRRHFEVTSPSFVTLSSVRAYFQSRHVCRQIYKQNKKHHLPGSPPPVFAFVALLTARRLFLLNGTQTERKDVKIDVT